MKKIQLYLIIFLSSFFLSHSINSAEIDIYKKIDLFGEVLEKINKEYVDEINQSESMDSAINGLLQSLDPYSSYMSPEIFEEMQTETSGEFGGLGIEVSMEAGVVKVITPIDDTPASKAGIKAGDYIVKINDIQVQGKSLSEAVDLMRGPVGSGIELTVRRRGAKKALTFNVVREVIEVQSVKSELLENNIGYLRLTSFNDNSSQQIKKQIKKLKKNKNLNSYILDLRNNPGGLLSQAIRISDFFLENGEIVSTKSRKKSENRKWFAKKGDITEGKTLVVESSHYSDTIPHRATTGRPMLISSKAKVTERFTRVSETELHYQYTVNDPEYYTDEFRGEFSLIQDPLGHIYEYACHEGNYAMANILAGARAEERK